MLSLGIASVLAFPPIPSLPKQTEVQKQVLANAAAMDTKFSPAGEAEVRTLLNSSVLRTYLGELDESAGLHLLSADALYQRLFDELGAAELVHNFGEVNDASYEGNCGFDITLDDGMGPKTPYFMNQWLLQSLGKVPVDGANNIFTEKSETEYFHFPPFKNVTVPDVSTSGDRPTYAALNMYRGASANAQCGPIAAIFSREFVGNSAIAAPVDTGLYVGVCGYSVFCFYPSIIPVISQQVCVNRDDKSYGGIGPCEDCINCDAW